MYFVLCIVVVLCIVDVYHSAVLCQQSSANFFNNIFLFITTYKFNLCKLLMFFSSDVGFSMSACSVRRSAGAGAHGHVMYKNHKIFIYQPIFKI